MLEGEQTVKELETRDEDFFLSFGRYEIIFCFYKLVDVSNEWNWSGNDPKQTVK